MIDEIDTDNNRKISFDEFLEQMSIEKKFKSDEKYLKTFFNLITNEESEYITIKELRDAVERVGETYDDSEI